MTTPTTPTVPLRIELEIEVPGTPEQVWEAIATANGISAWMIPTDLEERLGGVVRFHMGPELESTGHVTGWEPPRRIEYAEPDWNSLAGRPEAPVTPLVSEFLVEARSGGTCVVRVVSSAFGVGADWEQEFITDMKANWFPLFDHLRLYLAHFPGQLVTPLEVSAEAPGSADAVWAAVRSSLDVDLERGAGQAFDARGVQGVVEMVEEQRLIVRTAEPVPSLLSFSVGDWDGATRLAVAGYVYGPDAPTYVEREQPAWQAWADGLAVGAP